MKVLSWLATLVLMLFADGLAVAGTTGDTRPNFIFTDHQQFAALGENGNPPIQTPHLDKFAESAVRFENAYAVFALCAPSRAAALTGQHGSRNGKLDSKSKLKPTARTFAHRLKGEGYATAVVGKWHLERKPADCGFQKAVTFWANGTYYGQKVAVDGVVKKPAEMVDEFCVDRSIDWLRERGEVGSPFVLYHCTQLPNMDGKRTWPAKAETLANYDLEKQPLPETWDDPLTGKPPYLPDSRNRVVAQKEYGYGDASEHGMTRKILAYEESIRVPLLIAGPGLKPGVRDEIALNIDIAPTLFDLAGVAIPEAVQGKSLVPVLEENAKGWREYFVYEGLGTYANLQPHLAAVGTRWKLIRTLDDKDPSRAVFDELYDLKNDPNEMDNLAAAEEHAGQREKLAEVIDAHLAEMGPETLTWKGEGR